MQPELIDNVLREAVTSGRVPGVVAGLSNRDGPIIRSAVGAGYYADSVFRIASMTKLVTSVAVMQLVDDGAVDLEAPLENYLPEFRQPDVLDTFDLPTGRFSTRRAKRKATLTELLTHTAGYGYWFLDEPLRLVSGDPPDLLNPPFLMHDPGERFSYGTSADVIGQLFAPLTGLPIHEFFRQKIFEPLNMPDTAFSLPVDRGRLVAVRRPAADGFSELPNESRGPAARGGGGLYSTVDDYSRLLRCLLGGGVLDGVRILTEESAAEIGANQIGSLFAERQTTALPERTNDFIFMDGTQRFGLGVMVETRDQPGARSAGSFGWGGILNSYFWVDPAVGIAAVLLMQLAPFADPNCISVLRDFEAAVYRM